MFRSGLWGWVIYASITEGSSPGMSGTTGATGPSPTSSTSIETPDTFTPDTTAPVVASTAVTTTCIPASRTKNGGRETFCGAAMKPSGRQSVSLQERDHVAQRYRGRLPDNRGHTEEPQLGAGEVDEAVDDVPHSGRESVV